MSSSMTNETAPPKSDDGVPATSPTDMPPLPSSSPPPPTQPVTSSPTPAEPAEVTTNSSTQPATATDEATTQQQISSSRNEEGLIREMRDFDSLLRMLSMYRDNPDIRGNPGDKNIEEIAKVLSNFIGDDVDNFLSDEEEDGDDCDNETTSDNHPKNNHDNNNCC